MKIISKRQKSYPDAKQKLHTQEVYTEYTNIQNILSYSKNRILYFNVNVTPFHLWQGGIV